MPKKTTSVEDSDTIPTGRDPKRIRKLKGVRRSLRDKLIKIIDDDVYRIVDLQKHKSPLLDAAAKLISATVTHEFYITSLPLFFWCGYSNVGRNLTTLLALGIYFGNVVKDYFCLPRPLSPPVQRGETNHEYGLPSTHSVNSLLLPLTIVLTMIEDQSIDQSYLWAITIVGIVYAGVVGLARMYLGVHSLADVIAGYIVAAILLFVWFGLGISRVYLTWISSSDHVISIGLAVIILLLCISPEPVDPCPCFEDSVCFLACVAGLIIGEQNLIHTGIAAEHIGGTQFDYEKIGAHNVFLRKVVGFTLIILTRVIGKYILLQTLPSVYHLLDSFTRDHVNEYCKYTLPDRFSHKPNRQRINQAIYLPTKFFGYLLLTWSAIFLSPYAFHHLSLS
eukprot:TRINITY_DN585_c0_g8_i1.p1 TRINITY_DN585_c0_g8~~TRINITY_DN585_c0_g8_i1.p1  ORF type:complete len:392 (+),score=60.16 TRINITY_DN585_c0_g8_i1:52-1227(+)